MELIQNRNSTQDLSDLVVFRWDSIPQMSSYDNNIIIVLGVLTFALQLCLALLVLRRCLNLDKKIREATECPQNLQKLQIVVPSSCQQDVSKQTPHRFYDDCFLTSPGEGSAPTGTAKTCLFGPYIHWDLVQN